MFQISQQDLNQLLNVVSQTIIHAQAVPIIQLIQQSCKPVPVDSKTKDENSKMEVV